MASLPDHLMPAPVGKERISQEVLEEHQREKAIAAAIGVFAERGYQGTTVDDIVAAAKIGVGSFYTLFEGKEDCFLRSYDLVLAGARARVEEAIPPDGEWPEQAKAALLAGLEWIEVEPAQARLALVEVQTAGPVALKRYRDVLDGIVPLLARGRESSPSSGELPDSYEEAIVGGLAWFLQHRIVTGQFKGAGAHLPDVLEIVVEPYAGEKATATLL